MATRVAIDALGGDRAPDEVVAGAVEAASGTIVPVLYGTPSLETSGLELVECTEAIAMHEKPADAVRAKPDSSLVRAVRAVGDGDAAAVVSAGNTGAVLAASLLHVRRLPGVLRPGIAIVIPSRRGPTVLIDAGANAEARPEHLVQFAHMGVVFAEDVLDVRDPSVRLLSIGEEPEKGNQLTLEAHALLAEADLRFDGNTEGRGLLEGEADVVVCDGFTGNVALKTLEGTIRSILEALRSEIRSSVRGRVGGLLIRPAARGLRARLDPETTGGGYLLGLKGLVVIAHGSSSRVAVGNATRMAARGVEHRLVERLAERLPAARGEARSSGARSSGATVER
ncbi:MAG TPA: phosphate acyltransferase PlsX [Gaiella sp.]|uniref:phosphate acyltransferase PlsX n=1 Tax=Gaiella sp. TaxID=2663207 RepID=UPI002D80AB2A|nr:phosphate acyltransferase PlsX [Gaiella sp.]HET9287650.1 phosphate acyltransferase PlsX [Gaiella sp.]